MGIIYNGGDNTFKELIFLRILFIIQIGVNMNNRLKLFNGGVIWVDQNPHLNNEINFFDFIFGDQFCFKESPQEARKFVDENNEKNYFLMTSSKLIQEMRATFNSTINTYNKFIVFCGQEKTCKECREKFGECILIATTDYAAVSDAVYTVEEKIINKKKNMEFSKRVVWVYHDEVSKNYAKAHLKQLKWNFLLDIEFMDYDECEEEIDQNQQDKFTLITNGSTKLHKFLEEKGNLQCWIKYEFLAPSDKKEEEEEDDEQNELYDPNDGQGVTYAKNIEDLVTKVGVSCEQ